MTSVLNVPSGINVQGCLLNLKSPFKMCRGDYECEGSEHEVVDKESGWVTKVAKKRVVGDSSSRSDRRSQRGGMSDIPYHYYRPSRLQ